jgi:hypothetical protein
MIYYDILWYRYDNNDMDILWVLDKPEDRICYVRFEHGINDGKQNKVSRNLSSTSPSHHNNTITWRQKCKNSSRIV